MVILMQKAKVRTLMRFHITELSLILFRNLMVLPAVSSADLGGYKRAGQFLAVIDFRE